jgi:dihydroxy-acid dehydratase
MDLFRKGAFKGKTVFVAGGSTGINLGIAGFALTVIGFCLSHAMSLLGSSQMASPDAEKADSAAQSADVLVNAVRLGIRPRDIITRKSIENAVALIMATGGSTNAVLHYLAIASAAGVRWTIDDFERVRRRVPVLCDLKPSGRFVAVDFHRAGGVPQVLKMLLKNVMFVLL